MIDNSAEEIFQEILNILAGMSATQPITAGDLWDIINKAQTTPV